MEVEFKNNQLIRFSEVKIGDVFIYDGKLYLKLPYPIYLDKGNNAKRNVLCISSANKDDYYFIYFDDYTVVTNCISKMIVSAKQEE